MGDVSVLWEPTPWAMGVERALLQTIAHGVRSYKNPGSAISAQAVLWEPTPWAIGPCGRYRLSPNG